MKKFIRSMLSAFAIIFVWLSFCHWAPFWVKQQDTFPYTSPYTSPTSEKCKEWSADLWNCVSATESKESILNRLLDLLNIDVDKNSDHKFLNYVKAILNLALGLLSMVALVMTIYTFYLMFFTDNEAWAKKAKWNLIGIFIALAIIWLSWLIVSFIFRRYKENRRENPQLIDWVTMVNNELTDHIYLNV